jgi:hypothetical protein
MPFGSRESFIGSRERFLCHNFLLNRFPIIIIRHPRIIIFIFFNRERLVYNNWQWFYWDPGFLIRVFWFEGWLVIAHVGVFDGRGLGLGYCWGCVDNTVVALVGRDLRHYGIGYYAFVDFGCAAAVGGFERTGVPGFVDLVHCGHVFAHRELEGAGVLGLLYDCAGLVYHIREVLDRWGDSRGWCGCVLTEACWVGELGDLGWIRHRDAVSVLLAWVFIWLTGVSVLLTWV